MAPSARLKPGPIPEKSIWREYFFLERIVHEWYGPAGTADAPTSYMIAQSGQDRQRRCARLRLSEWVHEIGLGQWIARHFALALLTGAAPTHAQTPQGTSVEGVAKKEPKIVAIRIVKEDGQVLSDSPTGIAVEAAKHWTGGKSQIVCARFTERVITPI